MQLPLIDYKSLDYYGNITLHQFWCSIRYVYFPERDDLDRYDVYWSKRRQKRVLASCNVRVFKISVAQELNSQPFYRWIGPILYHEMCHAYFGEKVPRENGKRAWHGKAFKLLERRHPKIGDLHNWIRSGGWREAVKSHRFFAINTNCS